MNSQLDAVYFPHAFQMLAIKSLVDFELAVMEMEAERQRRLLEHERQERLFQSLRYNSTSLSKALQSTPRANTNTV